MTVKAQHMKMTYDDADAIAGKILEDAKELSLKYSSDGEYNWPFIAGCLRADIRILLMGNSRYQNE